MDNDYRDIAAGFMSMSPRARLEALQLSQRLMDPDKYESWKSGVTSAARTLRAAGARPVGSVPARRLAPHEARNISRTAANVAKAHAAGRPGAPTLAQIATGTPRTAAPAPANGAEYAAILKASGVRPEARFRAGYYTGGIF